MTGALVLPEDVRIVSLAEFPPSVRTQVGGDIQDYAVTRPHHRQPSKIIDAQAAELLRQFKTPTTLVEAIRRFSRAAKKEPVQVLEEVYPFLESCLIARLLVEPGSDSEVLRATFRRGDVVLSCHVKECVQVLNDTEIYRVSAGDVEAALKIARRRSGPLVNQSLERESKTLVRLAGRVAPPILSSGVTDDGRAYILQEWICGVLCGEAAAAIRAAAYEPLPGRLLSLCSGILDAYATLHSLDVIHSDVHTNNLLVTENGDVRIIDYGLARSEGDDFELALAPRAGVGFFFEPEYARAALSGSRLPLSSRAGEQYSVAALIYFLLSGRYYLDFAYGKEDMLRQIVQQSPLPLSARGLPGARALDDVLLRALSKDPSLRFADMNAMATAFRDAAGCLAPPSRQAESSALAPDAMLGTQDRRLKGWLDLMLNSLSDPTMDWPVSGAKFPTASLTYGAAGIAYGLFRIACVREDAALFALANRWLDRAGLESGHDSGFYHPDLQITPETVGRVSPYHSPAGVACVQSLMAHSEGDLQTRSAATQRFLKLSNQVSENLDITLGRSSTLLSLALLVDAFRWDPTADCECLIEFGNQLLKDLWEQFDAMPPIGDPKFPTYLGMAHGWAGYLYATLRWMRSAPIPPPKDFQSRLKQLADLANPCGSRVSWPCETRPNSPVLGGWCNGSAGFVFLWSLAHRLLGNPQWLLLAEAAGQDASRAREEGSSLCCGLAGKAYSQLTLYKHTGNRKWLDNATAMARLATRKTQVESETAGSRFPLSLYKGDLGLAVLLADLAHPESSTMPFFEDEAWPCAYDRNCQNQR